MMAPWQRRVLARETEVVQEYRAEGDGREVVCRSEAFLRARGDQFGRLLRSISPHAIRTLDDSHTPGLRTGTRCQCANVVWSDLETWHEACTRTDHASR